MALEQESSFNIDDETHSLTEVASSSLEEQTTRSIDNPLLCVSWEERKQIPFVFLLVLFLSCSCLILSFFFGGLASLIVSFGLVGIYEIYCLSRFQFFFCFRFYFYSIIFSPSLFHIFISFSCRFS